MPVSVGRSAATWATMLAIARPPSQGPKSAAATAPTMPQNARLWLHVPWKSGLAHPARITSESALGRSCAAPTTANVSGRGSSEAMARAIPRWPNCIVSPGRMSGDTFASARQANFKRRGCPGSGGPGRGIGSELESFGHRLEQRDDEQRNARGVALDAPHQARRLIRAVARERPRHQRAERGRVETAEPDDGAFEIAAESRAQLVEPRALGTPAPYTTEQHHRIPRGIARE